jgi:hypothetical protein
LRAFERRSESRPTRISGARIIGPSGHTISACTVANLSPAGALLRAVSCSGLEGGFGLLIDGEEQIRGYEIAWRQPHQMGVRFTSLSHSGLVLHSAFRNPVSVWSERAYLADW